MNGRFGYSRLPSMYEDTDTPELKAEREMFAEIAESRSPQEYIEILRRYNNVKPLIDAIRAGQQGGMNPLARRVQEDKLAALEASRKEVERQHAQRKPQDPFAGIPHKQQDPFGGFSGRLLSPSTSKPPVPPSQLPPLRPVAPAVLSTEEGEWWPYDPDKPIGDGSRDYQQRFQLQPTGVEDDDGRLSPIRLTPEEGRKGE